MLSHRDDQKRPHIDIYVNHHAEHPLPLEALLKYQSVSLFGVPPGQGNLFRQWARIVPNSEADVGQVDEDQLPSK